MSYLHKTTFQFTLFLAFVVVENWSLHKILDLSLSDIRLCKCKEMGFYLQHHLQICFIIHCNLTLAASFLAYV